MAWLIIALIVAILIAPLAYKMRHGRPVSVTLIATMEENEHAPEEPPDKAEVAIAEINNAPQFVLDEVYDWMPQTQQIPSVRSSSFFADEI